MNYNSSIRSNYFKITDRDAFKKLCDKLSGEDSVEVSLNEQNMACISCYGMLTWDDNEDDDDIDIDLNKFYELLQASYIKTYGKWPSKKQELCSKVQHGQHNTSISIILA